MQCLTLLMKVIILSLSHRFTFLPCLRELASLIRLQQQSLESIKVLETKLGTVETKNKEDAFR
jgi:hypothetical protein